MQENVLVIDDDVPLSKTVMWAMEDAGHTVELAHDGKTALLKMEKFVPGVVICDIEMPGMSGWELCVIMKKDNRLENTIFIANTGLSHPHHKKRSLEAGFKHHLVKPFDMHALLELIAFERNRLPTAQNDNKQS